MERLNAPLVKRRFSCICSDILTIPTADTFYTVYSQTIYYQGVSKMTIVLGLLDVYWRLLGGLLDEGRL